MSTSGLSLPPPIVSLVHEFDNRIIGYVLVVVTYQEMASTRRDGNLEVGLSRHKYGHGLFPVPPTRSQRICSFGRLRKAEVLFQDECGWPAGLLVDADPCNEVVSAIDNLTSFFIFGATLRRRWRVMCPQGGGGGSLGIR